VIKRKLEHLLGLANGDVHAVEASLNAAVAACGDQSPALQVAYLEALQALDGLHADTTGSQRFAADERLMRGYGALKTFPTAKFWKAAVPSVLDHRAALWAQETRAQAAP
jgi:hypothetical protein